MNEYEVGPDGPNAGPVTQGTAAFDPIALLSALLRRWKVIAFVTALSLVASYGAAKLLPVRYRSTVEILIYDPQRQIDSAIQKPISPFVDAIGFDAINTEIRIIKSKSVALRVARELGLDKDSEFRRGGWTSDLLRRLGLTQLMHSQDADTSPASDPNTLDEAADALLADVDAWPNSYIISVSADAREPDKAQLIAQTIATDYLLSQREARQEALEHVAGWLKERVETTRSRVLQTEAAIKRLKAENGIRDTEFSLARGQQVSELNMRLIASREEANQKRARLQQAHHIVDTDGDARNIPELSGFSALEALRQKQIELSARIEDLQSKLGGAHQQVIASRAALAAVNKQVITETEHMLGTLQNDYELASSKTESLEADLQRLASQVPSDTYTKLQQLRASADADHNSYESYVSQYNDISERRTLQNASARIISPATLPRAPISSKRKLVYGLGGASGVGGGMLLALVLEYSRRGLKTRKELEDFSGRPVLGVIPMVRREKAQLSFATRDQSVKKRVYLEQAVYALRISLELLGSSPKVVLVTSALPAEGKSTAARLLAASSASAGRRTLLLDCDLHHQRPAPGATPAEHKPGLTDVLRNKVQLSQVIETDPIANCHLIRAGSPVPNPADWLLSQRMREIIDLLRSEFDYIVIDTPPLLPVVDALVVSTLADKILLIVAWGETPRSSISEAIEILRPEAHRLAGVVFNKVDADAVLGHVYGRYAYPAIAPA